MDAAYFLDNAGFQHKLVATVTGGTITFLDSHEAAWVEQATLGLPRAATLKTRAEALADLREAEGLSEELEVREQRSGYVAA